MSFLQTQEITPESQLLVRILHCEEVVSTEEFFALSSESFLELVETHELVAFLYHRYGSKGFFPKKLDDYLKQRTREHATKALLIANQTASLSSKAKEIGLELCVYKGAALGAALYDSIAQRRSLDLDFVVKQRDAQRCISFFQAQGYQAVYDLSYAATLQSCMNKGVLNFYNTESGLSADVHIEELLSFGFAQDAFREVLAEREELQFVFGSITSFSFQAHCLLTFLHAGVHGWTHLKWLADVNQFLASNLVDWEKLRVLAEQNCCREAIAAPLLLSHKIFGSKIPEPWQEIALGSKSRKTSSILYRQLFNMEPWLPEQLRIIDIRLRLFDSRFQAISFLFKTLFKPSAADYNEYTMLHRIPFFMPIARLLRLIKSRGYALCKNPFQRIKKTKMLFGNR